MGKKKKNRSSGKKMFGKADLVVVFSCLACICLSAAGMWYGELDYRVAQKEYGALGRYVELKTVEKEGSIDTTDQVYDIDWNGLREVNPDIVAWIIIPDTVVNYPVVQTTDNSSYLHRSFEGTDNSCGAIFMNTYNRADFTDMNTVLYGHNMKDGSMFAVINRYKNREFFEGHNEIWILTPYWERKYQIISVHKTVDGSETYAVEFGQNQYEAHISSEVTQSDYDTGAGYDIALPMLTLSTCTGRGALDRRVLICQPVYETVLDPYIENKTTGETVQNPGENTGSP